LTDLQEKIRTLERERSYYQDSYEDLEKENQALSSDLKSQILTLEKEMWSLKGKVPAKRGPATSNLSSTSNNPSTTKSSNNIHTTKPASSSHYTSTGTAAARREGAQSISTSSHAKTGIFFLLSE
jgi:chromosome segregation ATPase